MTVVVADTGDIEAVRRLKPQDCTTNPTLLLKAVETPAYGHFLDEALHWGRAQGGAREAVAAAVCDRLAVAFGAELAGIVPGRVSTEVDADLSFDAAGTVDKAAPSSRPMRSAASRAKRSSSRSRPPGRASARRSFAARGHRLQPDAAVLALAGDGLRRRRRVPHLALRRAHPRLARQERRRAVHGRDRSRRPVGPAHLCLYKTHGVGTVVMGASFRNAGEIEALAGCDRLTISPALLDDLANDHGDLPRRLAPTRSPGARPGSASTKKPSASSSTRTRWRPRSCRGHPPVR